MQIKGKIVWNENYLSNRDMCHTQGRKIERWDGFLQIHQLTQCNFSEPFRWLSVEINKQILKLIRSFGLGKKNL